MSTQKLVNFANKATPSAVEVPNSWPGLVVWAAGQWGAGIIIASMCAFALSWVYQDYSAQVRQYTELLKANTQATSETTAAITQLRESLENLNREAQSAHRNSTRPIR